MPEVDVYCLSFYKKDCKEYQSQPPLDSSIHNIYRKTNIVVSSSYGNTNNGAIFEEGYNEIYEIFKDYDGKILILAEDHFFTSGKILKEFKENECDIFLGGWDFLGLDGKTYTGGNGSILGLKPQSLKDLFPLDECEKYPKDLVIEYLLYLAFIEKNIDKTVYVSKFRSGQNYGGDGCYTNRSNFVKKMADLLDLIGAFEIIPNDFIDLSEEEISSTTWPVNHSKIQIKPVEAIKWFTDYFQ